MFRKKSNLNFPAILRMLGWLLMIEAMFMLAPLVVGVIYEEIETLKSILYSVLITATSGAIMAFGLVPKNMDMQKRDGLLLVPVVWAAFSFFGALPFLFTGTIDNMAGAFMEAMSGFTTTGLSVITDVEILPKSILFWRAVMHWVGGMGIILFSLAVLPMLNYHGGMQLFNAEVTGITHDKLRPRVSSTAKSLWMVYIVLSIIMAILLWAGPMNLFDALCHTMSALSTGGFSTKNSSIAWWDSTYVTVIVTIFMFLGGMNFALLYKAARGDFRSLWHNGTFKWYCCVVLISTTLVAAYVVFNKLYGFEIGKTIVDALFTCVSVITSTGLLVADIETWGEFTILIMCILMFFGACAGSTAGAAKIDRLELMMKNIANEFYRVLHPNSIVNVHINRKVVPQEVVSKAIVFLGTYMCIIVVSAMALVVIGIPMKEAFFSSLSALGNIGIGIGSAANGCYASYPAVAKWLLSIVMLIGRLELFTFLVLFTRDFWHK